MFSCSLILSTSLLLVSAAPSPAYTLKVAEKERIEAVLTYKIEMPKLVAQEWIVYLAQAPELPGQVQVHTRLEPDGKATFELSPEHRPMMLARLPAQGREKEITLHVKYQATLRSRDLVPVKTGKTPPTVAPLADPIRQILVETRGDFDWKAEPVQKWVREHQLGRHPGESDVDFARRVFVAIKRNFSYEYKTEMNRHASAVCRAGKTDCGGLSVLLVTILRGHDIPARTLVGRWAQSSKAEDTVGNNSPYYQTHVKAEFYAEGIGWVPADLASALYDKKGDGLNCFGHDPGDFLTQHVDPHLRLDSIHFGKQDIEFLQGPAYWVTGRGNIEPTNAHEKWEVRKLP